LTLRDLRAVGSDKVYYVNLHLLTSLDLTHVGYMVGLVGRLDRSVRRLSLGVPGVFPVSFSCGRQRSSAAPRLPQAGRAAGGLRWCAFDAAGADKAPGGGFGQAVVETVSFSLLPRRSFGFCQEKITNIACNHNVPTTKYAVPPSLPICYHNVATKNIPITPEST